MRFLFGVSIFCFVCSWLFLLPDFSVPNYFFAGFLLVLGGVLAIMGMVSVKPRHVSGWYVLFVVPGLIGFFVVPFPFNSGFIFVVAGVVFVVVKWWRPVVYSSGVVAAGLFVSGGVLIAQALVYPFYLVFISHVHRADVLSPIVAGFLNVFGLSAAVNQGLIFVQTSSGTFPVSVTWEKLGLMPWLFLVVGFVVVMVLLYQRLSWWKPVVWLMVVSSVVVVVRFVVMVVWFVMSDDLWMFWDPVVVAVSFIPLGVVIAILFGGYWGEFFDDPFGRMRLTRRHILVGFIVFVCMGSVVGVVGYHDSGMVKAGRVLIDEVHSDWEDSVRPLDTEWFGLLSTYNYYSWAEWINATYVVRRNVDQMLSEDVLSDVDVLILKCPTNSYSAEEIGAITQFVEDGGGLWLIGDHTDVFGMNTFLNQVAPVFGIRFRNDATYVLGSGNMTGVYRPEWFVHPIMMDVSEMRFMTSCTLEAPLGSENVIVGRGLIAEPGTYATENFFRESIESAEAEFGMFLQMVAVKYGAGRVVAFTDSTVFSSFSVFSDGYQDLTMGTLNYLNRENGSPESSLVLWGVAIVCGAIVMVVVSSQRRREVVFTLFVAGVVAVGVWYPLVGYLNEDTYSTPEMRMDVDRVLFDLGHTRSMVNLEPTVSLFEEPDNFGTLYVWSQRLGLKPDMCEGIGDSLLDARVLVLINPSVSFEEAEISLVHRFVDGGGSVVVFDSIQNEGSTANEVLGGFGLWLYFDAVPTEIYTNISDNATLIGNITRPVLQISGGESLGSGIDNVTVIRGVEIMNESTDAIGRVVAVVDSYSFSNKVVGGPLIDPDEGQKSVYETIFYLYRYLTGDDMI